MTPAQPAHRALVEPVEVIAEVVLEVDPALQRTRLDNLIRDVARTRSRQRVLAHALVARPSLLTSGNATGPPQLEKLIAALLAEGSTAFTRPRCGQCGQQRALRRVDPDTGTRVCEHCARRAWKTCSTCSRRSSTGHTINRQPVCRPCYQTALHNAPPLQGLMRCLRELGTGLDDGQLEAIARKVLPTAAAQQDMHHELTKAPTRPRTDPAAGSHRLILLVEALYAHHAHGIRQPVCSVCSRDRPLRYGHQGRRCCKSCYTRIRRRPCTGCDRVATIHQRSPHGDRLCRPCAEAAPINHALCSGCQQHRLIAHRDGEGEWCRSCRRGTRATCTDCGELRPCHRASSDTPRCENCARKRGAEACSRCRRVKVVHARSGSGGALCHNCSASREACTRCGNTRKVATRAPEGPICARCWRQDPRSFRRCTSCNRLERLHHHGLCAGCAAPAALRRALGDDAGTIPTAAEPVFRALLAQDPGRLLRWLKNSRAVPVLQELKGQPVSHEALDGRLPNKAVQFLRAALVDHGILEARDEHLAALEHWVKAYLAQVPDPVDRRILSSFATWHHLRRLRAGRRPTTINQAGAVKNELIHGHELLEWLRQRGRDLPTCTQRDIDSFLGDGPPGRTSARPVLNWAVHRGYTSAQLAIPARRLVPPKNFIDGDERWKLARRLIHDEELPAADRLAGLLLLLFAQRLNRIRTLRVHDLCKGADGRLLLILAEKPIELPPPVDEIARAAVAARAHHYRVSKPDQNPWLLPGGVPGNPISINQLSLRLKKLDLPARAARNTALIDLAGQLPAAVISRLLGLDPTTASRWNGYANAHNSVYAADLARRS